MKALRLLILLMACGATGTPMSAAAAEPASPPPATPPAAAPAEKPAAESAARQDDEDSKDQDDAQAAPNPKTAASAADKAKGPSPQRFVPSEQVRADFDVSFPIDI